MRVHLARDVFGEARDLNFGHPDLDLLRCTLQHSVVDIGGPLHQVDFGGGLDLAEVEHDVVAVLDLGVWHSALELLVDFERQDVLADQPDPARAPYDWLENLRKIGIADDLLSLIACNALLIEGSLSLVLLNLF